MLEGRGFRPAARVTLSIAGPQYPLLRKGINTCIKSSPVSPHYRMLRTLVRMASDNAAKRLKTTPLSIGTHKCAPSPDVAAVAIADNIPVATFTYNPPDHPLTPPPPPAKRQHAHVHVKPGVLTTEQYRPTKRWPSTCSASSRSTRTHLSLVPVTLSSSKSVT